RRPRLRRRSILRLSGEGTPAPANDHTFRAVHLEKWCAEDTEESVVQAFLGRGARPARRGAAGRSASCIRCSAVAAAVLTSPPSPGLAQPSDSRIDKPVDWSQPSVAARTRST